MKDESIVFGRRLDEIHADTRKRSTGINDVVRPERFGSKAFLNRSKESDVKFEESTGPESENLLEALYKILELAQEPMLEDLYKKLGGYLATDQTVPVTLTLDPKSGKVTIAF